MKFAQKENFKPKIKQIIKNLQNERCQLENKQAKSAKVCANVVKELAGEKGSKPFFRLLKGRIFKFK